MHYMKPSFARQYRRRTIPSREGVMFKKENNPGHSFFGDTFQASFFDQAILSAPPQSVQRKCTECEKEDKKINRKVEEEEKVQKKEAGASSPDEEKILPPVHLEVEGSKIQNTTHNADCNGVSVSGNTQANYSSSASLLTRPTRATDCSGCSPANCVTINSTVVSRFLTAPVVSLPSVPGGLNPCERRAVRAFINGTLNQHEQQHVAAFNTYRGIVSTPISFTGCMADLQAEVQNIHDNVEVPRRQASDDASALLDANGANVFNITCECPDPAPKAGNP
jgi:hypothetical protein